MAGTRMTPITATFTWTPEELCRARRAWLRHSDDGKHNRKVQYLMFALGIGAITFCLIDVFQHGISIPICIGFAAGLAALVFGWDITRDGQTAEVRFRSEVRWEVFPDRIHINTAGKQTDVKWSNVLWALRSPGGFFLRPRDGFELWLTLSAFEDSDAIESFAKIAQSKARRYTTAGLTSGDVHIAD